MLVFTKHRVTQDGWERLFYSDCKNRTLCFMVLQVFCIQQEMYSGISALLWWGSSFPIYAHMTASLFSPSTLDSCVCKVTVNTSPQTHYTMLCFVCLCFVFVCVCFVCVCVCVCLSVSDCQGCFFLKLLVLVKLIKLYIWCWRRWGSLLPYLRTSVTLLIPYCTPSLISEP